jgi:hypothetical protein
MFKKFVYPFVIAVLVFSALGATAGVALAKAGEPSNLAGCKTETIKLGQKVTLHSGNAGVVMPSSGYAGTLEVCRASGLTSRTKDATLKLLRRPMWWTVDKHGETQDAHLHGTTLVTFQLTSVVPAAYKTAAMNGKLAIYRWNSGTKFWVKLPTTFNKSYNRLNARATGFGYYVVAMESSTAK